MLRTLLAAPPAPRGRYCRRSCRGRAHRRGRGVTRAALCGIARRAATLARTAAGTGVDRGACSRSLRPDLRAADRPGAIGPESMLRAGG